LKEVYSILENFKINCDVKLFKNNNKNIVENFSETILEKSLEEKSEIKNNKTEKNDININEIADVKIEKTKTNL